MSGRRLPAVRIEVLGALQVWRGDSLVGLGPVQQRVVLAVLALHANRPLGREQLIEAVWGSAMPTYAVNLLQKHMSGLRRALEPNRPGREPSQLLAWTDAGYLLTMPAGDLDLTVFDRELARARAARAGGDLSGAVTAFQAALRLWRGPLCDGLSSPFLDAERDRLAERRISAVEERIELDLALGVDVDPVPELRNLIAAQPLRERLRGLLMLALYRSGRQAEALGAFQDARRHLVEELGVEPDARLQQLHQQILAGDPVLAAPVATGGVPSGTRPGVPLGVGRDLGRRPPIPAQLPHGVPDFTGRGPQLDRLNTLMAGRTSGSGSAALIIVLAGTAGVGKSSLAVHWAHQIRDQFPDGQLYVNLRGFEPTGSTMDPAEAIRGFLDAFAVPPELIPISLEARAALYRSLVAGKRVLVVLDNARNPDQVRPLLPGSSGCLVVVTSRTSLPGLVAAEGAQPVMLDLVSTAEARELLARRLGRDRVAAEPESVEEIIALCARLPLALAIVAARAMTRPGFALAAITDELREARGSLDAFDGDDTATDIRAVFSWSYRTLKPDAAEMFRLLGLHPGPDISTPAAASLAGTPLREARAALTALAAAHLVNEQTHDRFTFHDLLRAYAAELSHTHDAAVRRSAVHRLLDHYLHSAHAGDRLLSQHGEELSLAPVQAGVTPETFVDMEQALAWFTAEHPVLLAVVDQAANAGFDPHTWQLSWAITTFLDRRGHWHDLRVTWHAALAAAQRQGDPGIQASVHRGLARSYLLLGRHNDAQVHLRCALDLYREVGDHTGQGRTYHNLGGVLELQGRHDTAREYAERALEMFRIADDKVGQADSLNAIGWYYAKSGDADQALRYCEQALTLHQATGARAGEAHTWDSLAYANHRLGRLRDAATCYEHAIELGRDLSDRYFEAHGLTCLGDVLQSVGDLDAARAAWHDALAILDEFGHSDADVVRAKLTGARQLP